MKKSFLLVFIFLVSILSAQSFQSIKMPTGLSVSNQLEYSYNTEFEREIFENWMNVDYRYNIFSAGIRFDIFQPNDPDPSISRGKERYADISYKYITANIGNRKEGLKLTVGNYYEMFGRGLVLKSYEDRNIRIDNNLLGVSVGGKFANFHLRALTGMAENSNAERKDILHAVDLEFSGVKGLKLGTTFASNNPEQENLARTELASFRIAPSIWKFDLYAEYGIKNNQDIQNNIFNGSENKIGEALYGNLNFYLGKFSIGGEYKYYDNYAFQSEDKTIDYNTPPSLRKDHTYILLNRHLSPLNQNNEKGFQIEVNYSFSENSVFLGNYNQTKTLGPSSYYQRVIGSVNESQTQLEDFYLQFTQTWSRSLETIFAFDYNEEYATSTKNITPILDTKYYFGDINTIRFVLEHQQSENFVTEEKYYNQVVQLEYLRSPDISISLVGEMKTSEPKPSEIKKEFWGFVMLGYKLTNHTDLSLLIGTRQAGNICVGGVCRYEPEFKGVELKMLTRLY